MNNPISINVRETLKMISRILPESVKEHTVIVGSLAAAHGLFKNGDQIGLRTKDVDCALTPHITASSNAKTITQALIDHQWVFKNDKGQKPGKQGDDHKDLPVARFSHPEIQDWFMELIAEPNLENQDLSDKPEWSKFSLDDGSTFLLPVFRFTAVSLNQAENSEYGIKCAKPRMMALANLLEHRTPDDTIISGTQDKRQNKDLGRVVAIGYLSGRAVIRSWMNDWDQALKTLYPEQAEVLFKSSAIGLERLLENNQDLGQAFEIAKKSLLFHTSISFDQFQNVATTIVSETKRK